MKNLLAVLLVLSFLCGCGGGGKTTTSTPTPTSAVTITMGSWPSTLVVGQTFQCTATVTNTTNTAVTWAAGGVTGGNATVGTISTSGLYTAPSTVPTPASVTITATSQADTTKSVSFSVTINISLATNLTSASLQVTGTQQFTATITGAADTTVTWAVNGVAGGNSTVGTISAVGLYTAPQVPPSPNTVTITATSVAFISISASITVTLLPPPLSVTVNPTALDLQEGQTVQFTDTVTATGSLPVSTAITWGVKTPGNPGGAAFYGSITANGLYTAPATPPTGALNPIPIYVVSQEDPTKYAISYVTVTTAPVLLTISTATLANGVANSPYSATISAFGGAQPYAWSISSGALPTGLALNGSTGVISGTPTAAGAFPFAVTVTDQTSPTHETATANLSITIIPQLSIATATLPSGSVGANYSASLAETGGVGPYTWTLTSGSLPSGLSLNSSTGMIAGIPATGTGATTGQQYPITLKVTDSGTPQQTQTFSPTLTIYNGVAITTTSPISTAFVGQPYTFAVQAVGGVGPYTWFYSNLPSWLSATPSTTLASTISGTPTAPAGPATFTVQITDSNGVQRSVTLSITVTTVLSFPAPTVSSGVANAPYTDTLTATGGLAPYTWTYTGLPAWLAAAPSTSLVSTLSGTPTTAAQYNFTAKVADSSSPPQTQTQALSITVYSVLAITTASLPNGTVNSSYSAVLHSTGGTGTITWTVPAGTMPAGLSLGASGTITGIPITAGTTSITVTAADSGTPPQTKNQTLNILVDPALSITTTTLPNGTVGTAYSQNIQSNGGTPPILWSVPANTLPTGLQLQGTSNGVGTITGNPTAAGSYTFTVTASDASTPVQSVNQQYTVVINNAPLAINTTQLPSVVVNTAYSEPLQASGGTPPYTWIVASGSTLPSWLSITGSGTNWTISGTPTAVNTYDFTLQVTDSSTTPQAKTQALSIAVTAATAACTDTGSESLLAGQYAFSLSGYNSTGFLAVVGSFTADGTGKITGGTVDSNGTLVQSGAAIDPTQSSYSVGSNHLGCATIVTSSGTFTTRLSVGGITSSVATAGRMIEWDNPSSSTYFAATGQILKQTVPSDLPSGSYAYQYAGVYGTGQYPAGVAGMITANAGTSGGTFTYGEYDINVAGVINGGNGFSIPFSGITGTYTNPDATTGRYTTATTLNKITANHVAYLVSSSQYLELQTDALSSTTSLLVGQGQLQTTPTGGFGNGSVNGNMVFYWTAQNGSGSGGDAQVGLASSTGDGAMNVTTYEDDAGTWKTPNPGTATCDFSVDSYGRMTFAASSNCGGALYLTAAGSALMLTPDTGVGIGQVLPQIVPSGGFSSSSFSNSYYLGDAEVVGYGLAGAEQIGVTVLTITSGSLMLIQDFTSTTNGQQADETTSGGTLSVNSDGTFQAGGKGNINAIMISTTEFVSIDNSSQACPIIQVGQQ